MSANEHDAWSGALALARAGDGAGAREVVARYRERPEPFAGAADLLLARCLAEAAPSVPPPVAIDDAPASDDLAEAVDLLHAVRRKNPENLHVAPILALAELRRGNHLAASAALRGRGLPTDTNLLAHFALSVEGAVRALPETLPPDWPGWPEGLEPVEADPAESTETETPPAAPLSSPPSSPGAVPPRRGLRSAIARIQNAFFSDRPVEAVRLAYEWLPAPNAARDSDLHLLCGLAAEEVGDADRARAHLARAHELEPAQYLARTFLARVHWRLGANELAEDLWRSLPVEGPDDYGRHYHLALAHEAAGRRADALVAMEVALRDFFMETREFHIERAYKRWLRATAGSAASGGESSGAAA